ncbi:unnamed protein product [Lymnaea stagnalis]|uniref:Uncharacterized protein n=1 Tax=Lymnaea stagnalis TaxID=6523 RepID=A0AAV2HEL3_LYMST
MAFSVSSTCLLVIIFTCLAMSASKHIEKRGKDPKIIENEHKAKLKLRKDKLKQDTSQMDDEWDFENSDCFKDPSVEQFCQWCTDRIAGSDISVKFDCCLDIGYEREKCNTLRQREHDD